jgi:hypothetical protein
MQPYRLPLPLPLRPRRTHSFTPSGAVPSPACSTACSIF